MKKNTIFISFKFDDRKAAALFKLTKEIATNLRRVSIVNGKNLALIEGFSGEISTYIKESADCLIGIFSKGRHKNLNIVFETGVAIGASTPIILIAESFALVPSMLRFLDIVVVKSDELDWQKDFRQTVEQKLRAIFQDPEDHFIENKLERRYMPEERRHFVDVIKVQAVIESIKGGFLRKAEGILKNMLDQEPDYADALFLLAETHYLRGCSIERLAEGDEDFERQLEITSNALQIHPNHVLILSTHARAQMRCGKILEARETLVKLLKIDEHFSVGYYDIACACALLSEQKEMLHFLEEAISLNHEWRDFSKEDPDFASYRTDSEWIALVY